VAFRTQPPRAATLGVALVLWLVGAAEMFAGVHLPHDLGRWALLLCGALLMLGSLLKGL